MKNMIKKMGLLFVVLIMTVLFAVSVSALDAEGKCGSNVYWTFDDKTGELVISGTGAMYDYDNSEMFGEKSPFYNDPHIKTIVIEEGVTKIGDDAFKGCDVRSVFISDSVTYIRSSSFEKCHFLSKVTIEGAVEYISSSAFSICGNLKEITLSEGTKSIGGSAFYATGLKSITLPNSIETINSNAFRNSKIESITLPAVPISISPDFLDGTPYYEENIKDKDVVYIGEHLIKADKTVENFSIKEGTLSIAKEVFYSSKLRKVYVPESVGTIAFFAFCSNKKVTVYYAGSEEEWKAINKHWALFGDAGGSVIYNHKHEYKETIVTEPSHLSSGEAVYSCICGDTYTDVLAPVEHDYKTEITKQPTHLEEGEKTFTCGCGYSYTESVAKLKEHSYVAEVTKQATHTEEGETTYTCLCGDTYTEAIEKLKEHSHSAEVTKQATHTQEGETTYTCLCGDTYTEVIAKLEGHTYVETVTLPTCNQDGYTTYYCACGDNYKADFVGALGHYDDDNDGKCDSCDMDILCDLCGMKKHTDRMSHLFCLISILIDMIVSLFSK